MSHSVVDLTTRFSIPISSKFLMVAVVTTITWIFWLIWGLRLKYENY